MTHLIRSLVILAVCLIAGCSQRFQDVNSTIDEALFGVDDIVLSVEKVEQLPYASMYVRINDGPQIFMVLAFVDTNPVTGNKQFKWLSSDSAMITTENGRVVKTTHLPDANLAGLSASNAHTSPTTETTSWQSEYDWQPDYHYGERAIVESFPTGFETVQSLLWKKETRQVQEVITFTESQQSMTSKYWIDTQGDVVKSQQWLVPQRLKVDIEILKPYAE
ncbi:putative lipoprotein [Vibrio sinaloensis DSM 21326]|uniref:Putative lipoprotein n=1 Tax=Vibrio sinaloensis DSM 21326 TaxID=945550 RepID=E8M9Z6_PHOS4|nr:YjbF family lipoprotein [Vibrio sinaloensis]EGA69189.1 putative lipoprotein [Vibrio sinaloensis DSM 21326]